MTKHFRVALLVAVGVACVATAAFASVPDPSQSSCPAALAYGPSGFIDILVNVKNSGGFNIAGSNVVIDFGSNYTANTAPGVIFCASAGTGLTRVGGTVSTTTDGSGNAHFPLKLSRCANMGVIKVFADGVQICTYPRGASVDFDGDGQVSVSDLGSWAATQAGADLCGDYNGDNSVSVADLGIWAAGQAGGGC